MSCGGAVHWAFGLDPVRDRLSDVSGLSRSRTVLGGMRLTASVPVLESGRRPRVVRRGPGRASFKDRS